MMKVLDTKSGTAHQGIMRWRAVANVDGAVGAIRAGWKRGEC